MPILTPPPPPIFSRPLPHDDTLIMEALRLRKVADAAKRLVEDKYIPWAFAGGVDDCQHGYGQGIPCPKCDRELILNSGHPPGP